MNLSDGEFTYWVALMMREESERSGAEYAARIALNTIRSFARHG